MGNPYPRLGIEKGRRSNRPIARKFSKIADNWSILRGAPFRKIIADMDSPILRVSAPRTRLGKVHEKGQSLSAIKVRNDVAVEIGQLLLNLARSNTISRFSKVWMGIRQIWGNSERHNDDRRIT